MLQTADTVTETDVVDLFANLPAEVGSRAGEHVPAAAGIGRPPAVLDHALADASSTLIESLKEAQEALDRVRNQTEKSDTALAQANITAIATQGELMAAVAQLQAYQSAREAGASYERELARRQETERWTAVLRQSEQDYQGPLGTRLQALPDTGGREVQVHDPSLLPVALQEARE